MQTVPLTFEGSTFQYAQLDRQGMCALYRQQHKESGVCRYEVIRIQIHRAHTWPNGTFAPECEGYPASSSWGQRDWTCQSLPEAESLFARLTAGLEVSV